LRRLLARFPTSTLMGLAFTIPAMLIAGLLLFYHSLVAQQFLAEEGARYGDILADQLLSASQRFLRLGSVAAVQEMIEDTGSNRSVVHVALIGNDGRVIGANRRDWLGQEEAVIAEPSFGEAAGAARTTFRTQHRLVDGGKRMILVAPLLVQGVNPILSGSRGILYIKVDQEQKLREIYGAILRRGTVSALGILLISLFLLLWVREILAKPILSVASFLRGFAAGSVEAAPRVGGTQEVAQLIEDVGRMVRDLREKRTALEASEERHRRLLEGAYDAILTVEPESLAILEVNDMFCRLFGYTPQEARLMALHDLHPEEERERLQRIYREVTATRHRDFHDVPCLRKNGERVLVDIRGGPISLGAKTVTEWIVRDMTDRRRLEDQLRQAQKMESVGTLAGGIAHDFNNLLTGILGYTRLLLNRLKPDDPNRKQMQVIERSAQRAAELTSQLLTFSRRAASRPAPASLNEVVQRAVDALRPGLPDGIEVVVRAAPDLCTAAIDQPQILQVLQQLFANAREAMPGGGRLLVETANRTLTEEECRGNLEARAGRFVTLAVEDTGRGIDPSIRPRIFEPFFTTKMKGEGTGLGLSMVYGSVKGHDGWVEVSSQPGRGSRFVAHLPVWDPATAAERVAGESPERILERLAGLVTVPAQAPGGAAGPGRGRTVLAVDDESTVLALAKDILEMHGYRVLTARNGEEALRLFRSSRQPIDLVLLDLTMPVMGGRECLKRLRELDPRVRVVISSGFSADATVAEILREGAIDYIQKPYDIDVLARVVSESLSRGTAPVAASTS
jgi:PAS domain S-box-containing protein